MSNNQETISAELLKKAGYREYSAANDYPDRLFEKIFRDKRGKRYALHIKYWFISQNGVQSRFWDFNMQLETEKGTVDFTTVQWFNQDGIYSGRTIEEVETYFEWLWRKHGKPYYEKVGG